MRRLLLVVGAAFVALSSAGCAELFADSPVVGVSGPRAGHGPPSDADAELAAARPCTGDGAPLVRVRGAQPTAFEAQYIDTDPSALLEFREVLEPYGTWEDDPSLGTVWFPSRAVVGQHFVPYVSAGRWVYDAELVWASDYAWGWAPFHYGRWAFAGPRGWAWIPGRRYAGAWVDWRTGDTADFGYVGWGPTPPSFYWHGGQALRFTATPAAAFVYCPAARLFAPGVAAHLVGLPDALAVASRTHPFTRGTSVLASRALLPFAATDSPTPEDLGIAATAVARPPTTDPGLQRAWLLARPSTAETAGYRPHLASPPPRLKTWVAGAPRYMPARTARTSFAN